MSNNEKYIAYTRALDELFIFEGIIKIQDNKDEAELSVIPVTTSKNNESEKKPKRKKRASKRKGTD